MDNTEDFDMASVDLPVCPAAYGNYIVECLGIAKSVRPDDSTEFVEWINWIATSQQLFIDIYKTLRYHQTEQDCKNPTVFTISMVRFIHDCLDDADIPANIQALFDQLVAASKHFPDDLTNTNKYIQNIITNDFLNKLNRDS